MAVSCPHKCSVQTLLRSEVRAAAAPLQGLGVLRVPTYPLTPRPEVITVHGGNRVER